MTAAIALAFLSGQGPAPTLPAGTSPEFARTAMAVEARLVAGDVPGAREAARALPLRTPRLVWQDEALLTPELRAFRDKAVARAAGAWAQQAVGFSPKASADAPDLTLGFAKLLPEGPDGLPLATEVAPGLPFKATIGLTRGKPGQPLRNDEMGMEIAYALGRYLGVSENPLKNSAMSRDARAGLISLMPQATEKRVAAANLDLAERLRAAIEAGKPTGLTVPKLLLHKERLDLGETLQGKPLRSWIEIENTGDGPLDYWIEPDCSCFATFPAARLASGGRGKAPVFINTADSLGTMNKSLILHSNDPLRPSIEIPVTFRARPAYRLFRPGGAQVVVPEGGGAYDVFLFTEPDSKLRPVGARWDGVEGKVARTPWSGTLADPEMGEGPLPRKGWRFRVQIPKLAPGRFPGTLVVRTDDPTYGTLMYAMDAQRGIVALQESVYLGDMVAGTRASATVLRPNAPFKILGVDAGPLKATWKDQRGGGWEYSIDLEYPGGAARGDFRTPVKIRTDDPKQPVIEVLASGNVK